MIGRFPIKINVSLREKILLLSFFLPLFTALIIGGVAYHTMTRITVRSTLDGFANETRLISSRLPSVFAEIKNDAVVASRTPPVQGLYRAIKNNGTDPDDGSTTAMWKSRLETIFVSIMKAKPQYSQISYVAMAYNGRELVKVSQTDGGLYPHNHSSLNDLGGTISFQRALSIKPDEVLVSDVVYGTDEPMLNHAIVKIFAPVFEKERLWGFIIISVDYEVLLQNFLREIHPQKQCTLTNQNGDHITYGGDAPFKEFELHRHYHPDHLDLVGIIKSSEKEEDVVTDGDNIAYFIKSALNPTHKSSYLAVALLTSRASLMKETNEVQNYIILLTVFSVTICSLFGIALSKKLMTPLKDMTQTLADYHGSESLNLPTERPDEVGDLARAFQAMTGKLRSEESKADTVFMSAFDGIFTLDAALRFQKINPACARIFGQNPANLIGKSIEAVIPSPHAELLHRYAHDYITQDKRLTFALEREIEGLGPKGFPFPLDITFIGTESGADTVFIGMVRDITSRKKRDVLRDSFISTVNNELRSPIISIQDALAHIRELCSPGMSEKCRRLLDLARENSMHVSAFLNDVLDMEKIASGKMIYNLTLVDVCPLVHFIVESQRPFADALHVTLEVQCQCAKALCRVDGTRFKQALINLLSNAMKFSPDGETVTIRVEPLKDNIRISVIDHGPGIPIGFQTHVFEKFSQAEDLRPKAAGGSGLGLNIAKNIIMAFDGQLTFETEEGKGTTFHITLPVAAMPLNPAPTDQPAT